VLNNNETCWCDRRRQSGVCSIQPIELVGQQSFLHRTSQARTSASGVWRRGAAPETFPARFIATHYRRGGGGAKALFGLGYFLELAHLVARCDMPLTWFLTMTRGETELPGFFAQFKGHHTEGQS
jgi:hypothetical protein